MSAVVERARALVGTRFRAQGRGAGIGLDCVGVAALALGVPVARVRRDYALRGETVERVGADLARLGLAAVAEGRAQAGDLVVVNAGPGQLHLAVLTDRGFVHADAGLGRVVERPGAPPWPVMATWRLEEDAAWRR